MKRYMSRQTNRERDAETQAVKKRKTIRLSVTVVTFRIVGQGSASLSTLNGFGLRLLVLRIRPSLRL